jgi:parallel beta-helix repeat protein
MFGKIVAGWISIALLLGFIVIIVQVVPITTASSILYVGGAGPGNYSHIQWAIDNASNGDTVYIYEGTYFENVIVNKSINLIGEEKNTTVINGGGIGDVVYVHSDWVNITDLTVTGSGLSQFPGSILDAGIEFYFTRFSSIINCNLSNNAHGILFHNSNNNTVKKNTVTANDRYGILFYPTSCSNIVSFNIVIGLGVEPKNESIVISAGSQYNIISNNYCSNSWDGIYLIWACDFNLVYNNTCTGNRNGICPAGDSNTYFNNKLYNNEYGIFVQGAGKYNIIRDNHILDNDYGLYYHSSYYNTIFHNNFINNSNQAYDDSTNYWNESYPIGGNFWSDYTGDDNFSGPNQDIPGPDDIGDTNYTISGGPNVDNYPLVQIHKPPVYFGILKQGWNLISVPLIQVNQNLSWVLENIDGLYDAVQFFNPTDAGDSWKHYRPGKILGNDLYELNETISFWIHIIPPGDTIFIYNGIVPTSNQTIQIYEGWNMVGYPTLSNHNRTVGLSNLEFGSEVDCIQWYDAATKTWHFLGQNDNFVPGRGYWMHSTVTKTWDVPL